MYSKMLLKNITLNSMSIIVYFLLNSKWKKKNTVENLFYWIENNISCTTIYWSVQNRTKLKYCNVFYAELSHNYERKTINNKKRVTDIFFSFELKNYLPLIGHNWLIIQSEEFRRASFFDDRSTFIDFFLHFNCLNY